MSTSALPEVPALSEPQRLLYTFVEPSRTMADLRRNASWWVPWLLISIVSVAFSFTLDKRIGWAQIMETQIQSNPKTAAQMDKLAPEQREKITRIQQTTARIAGYASPISVLLLLVMVAAVLLAIFNFGFGARLRFTQTMAIASYSFLPSIISSLLALLVLFFVAPDTFNIKNPVASSAGYFVPNSMPMLKGILGAFDIFVLWQIFLMAVGISQLSKVKKWAAFAAIFSLYFLLKLAGTAASSM